MPLDRRLSQLVFCLVLLFSVATTAAEGDWPNWRGPTGNGHSAESGLPVRWNENSIVWKTSLAGDGQSSPVIIGDRIFLTTALENGRQRVVFCVDRTNGKLLWSEIAWSGEPEASHKMNGWASASCAADEERVVAFFGRGGLHCFSHDGRKLWSKDLGKFEGAWGTAASPLIAGELVIQNCDAEVEASITGINMRTGEIVWKTPRDVPTRGGWSSPVLVPVADRVEVVLNGFNGVTGYELTSGKKLWFCKSFAGRGEPTVTPANGLLLLVNGTPGDTYAVRTGGSGDVTESHMAWHTPRKTGRDQPSPIAIDGIMIVSSMEGIAISYDLISGRELWKERLGGNFTSSPIAAGGLAYFQSDAGETIVIKPGQQLEIVARNVLSPAPDEVFRASLTPSRGQIFSRSNRALYCLTSATDH